VAHFLPFTAVCAFFALSLLCARFAFTLVTRDSSALFLKTAMTRVKSTARSHDDAADAGGEGVAMERDVGSKGHGSRGSAERIETVHLSNVGSHSGTGANTDEVSRTHSYHFGPLTVTISRIREMIANGYFVDGMARMPREETVRKPHADEAIVFEEFFNIGLRMPPHLVLSNILVKFQVPLHQLTPNAIVQLSKYIWEVASLGVCPLPMALRRYLSSITSRRRWLLMELRCRYNMGASISTLSVTEVTKPS
jgi:hypothetical protein